MHVSKLMVQGTSLVGLYIVPTDSVVFVPPGLSEEDRKRVKEVFQSELVELTIAGTGLLGVFIATNGEHLLVPHLLFEHEEDILKESGVPYTIIKTRHTCLGNVVLATKKGVLVSPELGDETKDAISGAFGLPVRTATLNGVPTIGSYIVANDTHGLASYEFSEDDLDAFEEFLGIKLDTGTVNLGATQIRSGLATNNKGFLIGQHSGGPEVVHADHALGFIGDDA